MGCHPIQHLSDCRNADHGETHGFNRYVGNRVCLNTFDSPRPHQN